VGTLTWFPVDPLRSGDVHVVFSQGKPHLVIFGEAP
jgi:hypothetical protein